MRVRTRSSGGLVLLVIIVVFALVAGTFGEMIESFRPGPDVPYRGNTMFSP